MIEVLLYIDAHDSAADCSKYFIPLSDIPLNVKRVLGNAKDPMNICIDEDGWLPMVEYIEDEEKQDAYKELCEEFFDNIDAKDNGYTLASAGVTIKFSVMQFLP